MGILIRWAINTLALIGIVKIVPNIHADDWTTLAIAAAVLGLLNAIVRPILYVLTLPITIITLGLFLVILNAAMLKMTAGLVPGFEIDGFLSTILASLLLSIVSSVTSSIGRKKEER